MSFGVKRRKIGAIVTFESRAADVTAAGGVSILTRSEEALASEQGTVLGLLLLRWHIDNANRQKHRAVGGLAAKAWTTALAIQVACLLMDSSSDETLSNFAALPMES